LSGENAGASSCPESVAEQLFAAAELTVRLTVVVTRYTTLYQGYCK